METLVLKKSFASTFPKLYQELRKQLLNWHTLFLKVSPLSHYLGRERLMVQSVFRHKMIVSTQDLHGLKSLLQPSPSDLMIAAIYTLLHQPHAHYLYIHPSTSFHALALASLTEDPRSLHLVSNQPKQLFETAQNFYLNDLENRLHAICSSPWKGLESTCNPKLGHTLEPYESKPSGTSNLQVGSFEAFQQTITRDDSGALEELLGDDFLSLRAILIDQASFSQIQLSDLETLRLLNPSCYWLIHLQPQEANPQALFEKLAHGESLGYDLWQLPNLSAYRLQKACIPAFGQWLLMSSPQLLSSHETP